MLARQSCIYDASILRRSVIQGSLKLLYLMSAKNIDVERTRVAEYTELLPKKQFASNEQPIKTAFISGHYGVGSKAEFIKENFVDYINLHKTGSGEGHELRDVHAKWTYGKLSPIVAQECGIWKELRLRMDARYAAANDYVHWNATGCFEVMQNLSRSVNDRTWRRCVVECFPIDIMLDLCSLAFARAEVLATRIRADRGELDAIIRRNKTFLKKIGRMRDKIANEIIFIKKGNVNEA